jgi:hypothetical protein
VRPSTRLRRLAGITARVGEGAERRAFARHRGRVVPFRRRLTLRVVVLPQARDAQGCSPFHPGLSPPGLSGRLELLPTNGQARTPAHAWNGGLRPLRLVPLDHSPPPHRAGTRRPPPRRGRAEYGRGWGEGDKTDLSPHFLPLPIGRGGPPEGWWSGRLLCVDSLRGQGCRPNAAASHPPAAHPSPPCSAGSPSPNRERIESTRSPKAPPGHQGEASPKRASNVATRERYQPPPV